MRITIKTKEHGDFDSVNYSGLTEKEQEEKTDLIDKAIVHSKNLKIHTQGGCVIIPAKILAESVVVITD